MTIASTPHPSGGVLVLHMLLPPSTLSGCLLIPQGDMGMDLRSGYTMGVQCCADKTEQNKMMPSAIESRPLAPIEV